MIVMSSFLLVNDDFSAWARVDDADAPTRRYLLGRTWGNGPMIGWCCLNPSSATVDDDPSVRRMIGFSKRENAGSLLLGNLSDLIETDPERMLKRLSGEHVYSRGAEHVIEMCETIVCAWGATVDRDPRLVAAASRFIRDARAAGRRVVCLGVTARGRPRHPLYLRSDAKMVELW